MLLFRRDKRSSLPFPCHLYHIKHLNQEQMSIDAMSNTAKSLFSGKFLSKFSNVFLIKLFKSMALLKNHQEVLSLLVFSKICTNKVSVIYKVSKVCDFSRG